MRALEPDKLRLMAIGTICLLAGILLLNAATHGWLGRPTGLSAQLALGGAFLLNLAGAWCFLRYFLVVLRDLRGGR